MRCFRTYIGEGLTPSGLKFSTWEDAFFASVKCLQRHLEHPSSDGYWMGHFLPLQNDLGCWTWLRAASPVSHPLHFASKIIIDNSPGNKEGIIDHWKGSAPGNSARPFRLQTGVTFAAQRFHLKSLKKPLQGTLLTMAHICILFALPAQIVSTMKPTSLGRERGF